MFPTRRQWEQWSLPSRYSALGLALAVIGLIVSLWFGLFPVASLQPRKELTSADIQEIARQLAIAEREIRSDEFFDRNLPGISAHLIVAIRSISGLHRRQYIIDVGDTHRTRVSMYVSSNRFVLTATDNTGEVHALRVPLDAGGVPPDQFVYLAATVGSDDNSSTLSLAVNGRIVGSIHNPFTIPLSDLDYSRYTIAADLLRGNPGRIDLAEVKLFNSTLSTANRQQLVQSFRNKYRIGVQ